jgi:hypothetical protein
LTLHVTAVSAEGAAAAAAAAAKAAAEAEEGPAAETADAPVAADAATGVPSRRVEAARRERRRRTGEVFAWDMGVAFGERRVRRGRAPEERDPDEKGIS